MQILVTGKQMKQLDQSTIKQMGIPSLVLMERAALAVFDCLKQHFPLKKHWLYAVPAITEQMALQLQDFCIWQDIR
ncbi:MAG: hypothetical protein ACLTC8_13365 [Lachnospiraceae bacterium]